MKLLQPSKDSGGSHLTETVAVAITILTINNELNQDAVRYDSCPVRKDIGFPGPLVSFIIAHLIHTLPCLGGLACRPS